MVKKMEGKTERGPKKEGEGGFPTSVFKKPPEATWGVP